MQPVPEKLRGPKTDWNWASYFTAKKQKLEAQFDKNREEVNEEIDDETKTLLKNVSIFVNGYTNPTAIELKYLMLKYGGYYYEYLNENITHIIASNLAYSKALALKNKLVVKPEWITDCIKEKKVLSTEPYLVIPNSKDKNQNKLTGYISKNEGTSRLLTVQMTPKKNERLKASRIIKPKTPSNNKVEIKTVDSIHQKDYDCFQNRINNFELPDNISKKQPAKEIEFEKIKHLLDDWIFWTASSSNLDVDDLQIFKGYLLHVLNHYKDLEKMVLILKLFKRLVVKNGSMEWVDSYKDVYSSIQADFYAMYDSVFNLT